MKLSSLSLTALVILFGCPTILPIFKYFYYSKFYDMKKFALLLITLVVLSCSEDESVNTPDQIIGSWDYNYEDIYQYTFIFNEDVTGTETYSYEDPPYLSSGTEAFTWENTASNPDFDSVSQLYTTLYTETEFSEPLLESNPLRVTFSSDFNSVTWAYGDDGGFFGPLTRN